MDLAVCPFITQDLDRIIKRRVIEPKELDPVDPNAAAAAAAGFGLVHV